MTDTRTKRRILLLTGCPRSGTTALASLLNHHPEVAVSNERYSKLVGRPEFGAQLFEPERFCRFEEGDCARAAFDSAVTTWARNKAPNVSVLGDKIPNAKRVLASLDRFDAAKVIIILRSPFSVAASFQQRADRAAVIGEAKEHWPVAWDYVEATRQFNQTVDAVRDFASRQSAASAGSSISYLVVNYEDIFRADSDLDPIFEFIGVDPSLFPRGSDPVVATLGQTGAGRSRAAAIERHVALNADFDGFREIAKLSVRSAADKLPGAAPETVGGPH